MSFEAISAGSHLFTTLAASLGLDFEQLQDLHNSDGFDALFDGQGGGSFSQVAYSTEQEIRDLTRLRVDPVADAVGDKTVLEDAYDGSSPDMDPEKDPSKIMQAARAIADKGGFSPEKREAFLQYIQDNRDSMKSATIENGKVILMADGARGGYHANTFRTNLPEDQRDVLTGTFTYTEGGVKKTETVYIFNDCANPAVDAAPDIVEPPKVVPPPVEPPKVCEPKTTLRMFEGGEIKGADGKPLTPEEQNLVIRPGEKVAVVQIEGSESPVLVDKNKDGDFIRLSKDSTVGVCWDDGEILPGITSERIQADLDAYEKTYGYRPEFLVYDVTDCDGKRIIACWNVDKGQWGFVYPDTKDGIPVGFDGKPYKGAVAIKDLNLILTREQLLDYLNQPGYKK
jgi:hypothetical protein